MTDSLTAAMRFVARFARMHPVSHGFAVLITVCGFASGQLLGGASLPLALGPQSTLAQGQWWTLVTALVVPDSLVEWVLCVLLALTVLAYAERLLGWRRTAVWMALLGIVSALISVLAHAALWSIVGLRPFEAAETPVLDPAIPIAAVALAASAAAPALWRRRLRLIGFATLAMFALYDGDADAWYRLAAAGIGLAVGRVMLRRDASHAWHRSSVRETRSLVAALVAVTALGPLAALISGGGRGPLARAAALFDQQDRHLAASCAASPRPACDHVTAAIVTHGVGLALLALVPLALLLLAAWGLRRGRRAAWLIAVTVHSALAGAWLLGLALGDPDRVLRGDALDVVQLVLADLALPLAMLVVLWRTRDRFTITAERRVVVRATLVSAAALVVLAALYLGTATVFRGEFSRAEHPGAALIGALHRFVPPALLEAFAQPAYPHAGAVLWAYQWVGVVFWAIVIAQLVRVFGSPSHPPDGDGSLYRELLRRGGGTLSWLGTWPGIRYWYADDRQSAIAYSLQNDVAIALCEPVGAPGHDEASVRGFIDLCAERGWTPVFYSVHETLLPVLHGLGWQSFSVGEETVIDLAGFTLAGKAFEKVRHPVTRAEREGLRGLWAPWHELPLRVRAQIEEISEAWVADKALPEMGFTLGGLEEAKDPEVPLFVAIDAAERVQGVTSWMPSWRDGTLVGMTLDFMRRRADGPNGVMEFLIAGAALRLKAEGLEVLSLSGAPLATRPAEPGAGEGTSDAETGAIDAVLARLATALEPVYGFASLFRFKSKFRPRYLGIHLAYADPLALPAIARAVGRAYLPDASARDVVTIARDVVGARP